VRVEDFAALVKRVRLNGLLEMMRAKMEVEPMRGGSPFDDMVSIRTTYYAPDSLTPGGSFKRFVMHQSFPLAGLDERAALEVIRAVIHGLFWHEIDEAIELDGARPFDPHAPRQPR
jgi:hypothetical protein